MNFTEIGIGFHDLARVAYGGDIYKTNGSHGCINLPLDVAAEMFDTIEVGYPVIVIPKHPKNQNQTDNKSRFPKRRAALFYFCPLFQLVKKLLYGCLDFEQSTFFQTGNLCL